MRLLLKTLASLSVTLFAASAFAQDTAEGVSKTLPEPHEVQQGEMKPSIAIFGGLADTQQNRRNGTSYGVEYGMQPYVPVSAALELSGYVSDHKGSEPTLTRTRLLAKANYNFGGNIPVIKNSYVGLGLGPVLDNVAHRNDLELGIAPQLGFDIPLTGTRVSLGANANYMFVGGAKADVFALNGVAKYWF